MGLWIFFGLLVVAVMALDLGLFNRSAHVPRFKEALGWSLTWSALALSFMAVVYFVRGPGDALDFLTGYLIEWSLSVDNIFIFLLIFDYFKTPASYQHRILFWGIVGAVVMRAILIGVGVVMIQKFHWIIYVFGGFLILTGIRMALKVEEKIEPERNLLLRLARKLIPMTRETHGQRFFVREGGALVATPLFIVLLMVESTDVIFAVDSVPAVLAITSDPFIVYTSNIFAILGLRSLYFLLAGVLEKFHLLRYGLAAILVFVGIKMTMADFFHFSSPVALGVIAALLALSMGASLLFPRREDPSEEDAESSSEGGGKAAVGE